MRKLYEWIVSIVVGLVIFFVFAFVIIYFFPNNNSDNNDGNSNHYVQKYTIMIERADTIHDTIYIQVPDQNAYNIGYFDGNFDAQKGMVYETIGVDTIGIDLD